MRQPVFPESTHESVASRETLRSAVVTEAKAKETEQSLIAQAQKASAGARVKSRFANAKDFDTESKAQQTADGTKVHRRWCNGEVRASPAKSEGFG